MIMHICVGTRDLEKAGKFYDAIAAVLGNARSATTDRTIDESDLAAGRRITQPTFIVWGSDYIGKGAAAPLDVWRSWSPDVTGAEIRSGHFLAEENPHDLLAALLPFLRGSIPSA
mgnify:CR=1 FL=1